ncbi:MAG TPA: hypothetical protein DIT93_07045 [Pelagibacterium sp.]|uniref:hypothetical protein n=1 Tax=uncultured Pelagibacterium sp. TaxID=1159875 RepID=UPI000EE09312|nr:hypothetical protein [Pelagibacterium sp.]|tara:strand:- start:99 stop:545 length:447 start_codon:yes stop_codon:yes gene_type:complete
MHEVLLYLAGQNPQSGAENRGHGQGQQDKTKVAPVQGVGMDVEGLFASYLFGTRYPGPIGKLPDGNCQSGEIGLKVVDPPIAEPVAKRLIRAREHALVYGQKDLTLDVGMKIVEMAMDVSNHSWIACFQAIQKRGNHVFGVLAKLIHS